MELSWNLSTSYLSNFSLLNCLRSYVLCFIVWLLGLWVISYRFLVFQLRCSSFRWALQTLAVGLCSFQATLSFRCIYLCSTQAPHWSLQFSHRTHSSSFSSCWIQLPSSPSTHLFITTFRSSSPTSTCSQYLKSEEKTLNFVSVDRTVTHFQADVQFTGLLPLTAPFNLPPPISILLFASLALPPWILTHISTVWVSQFLLAVELWLQLD